MYVNRTSASRAAAEKRFQGHSKCSLDLHVLELVDKNGDQVQPAKEKCLLQRRH
jgi:hypothetical protein